MTEPFENLNLLKPYSLILKVFIISFISIMVGVVLPGFIASKSGVFYESTMIGLLPKDAIQKLNAYNAEQAKSMLLIKHIDDSMLKNQNATGSDLATIEYLTKRNENLSPPIKIMPFYLNPIMLVWGAMYASLCWLIFIFSPLKNKMRLFLGSLSSIIIISALIYLSYNWTVWMRNFVLTNENRIVYSFANYDISSSSFYMQELNTYIFAILLAIVWTKWIAYSKYCINEALNSTTEKFQTSAIDNLKLEKLSKTYIHWQFSSIVLALGFIQFTSSFWDLIIRKNDHRYLIAGLTIHSLWGLSWLIISLPLILRWYNWNNIKARAINELYSEHANDENKLKLKLDTIQTLNPFGFWNITTSSVIALISFLLPIFQAFFK